MKIVFICSSLEPGRDGAGDQTRSLAGSLIKKGYSISAVSINEISIDKVLEDCQNAEEVELQVLRIPANYQAKKKYGLLSGWINRFSPDWVSIQYVGFGFHKYGLPWDLLFFLRSSIGKTKLNIMFQELWCGTSFDSKRKEKLLGVFQKKFISLMLKRLRPEAVFTNTNHYAASLKKLHINASLAPVFGNISLSLSANDLEWNKLINSCNLSQFLETREKWIVVGFFGTIYTCAGFEDLLQNCVAAAKKLNMHLGFLIIGHSRGANISLINSYAPKSSIWQTGQISPSLINKLMSFVDIGIITTPVRVLNKSSTVSAWLERGIPVAISSQDDNYSKDEMQKKGVFQINNSDDFICCLYSKGKFAAKNRFSEIVKTYSSLEMYRDHTTVHD